MKDSLYCYANGTLKNKFKIKDPELLKQMEADVCFPRFILTTCMEPKKFDENLLKKIHREVFSPVYTWAGRERQINMEKEERVLFGASVTYSEWQNISYDLSEKLEDLNSTDWKKMNEEELTTNYARKIAKLWRVHPFRDGNTRTILAFADLFARAHDFSLNLDSMLDNLVRKEDENGKIVQYGFRDSLVLASLDEEHCPDIKPLSRIFKKAMGFDQITPKKTVEEQEALFSEYGER